MIDPNDLITGQEWMEMWYECDKFDPYYLPYLSYDILKYNLTVIDRIELPGTEDEEVIGLSSENLAKLLKTDIKSLPSRWFHVQRLLESNYRFKDRKYDPKLNLWCQILGAPPRHVLNELERLEPNLADHNNVIIGFAQVLFFKFVQDKKEEFTFLSNDEKYLYIPHILDPSNIHKNGDIIEHKISNIELVSRVKRQESSDHQNSSKGKLSKGKGAEKDTSIEDDYAEEGHYESFTKEDINEYRKIGLKILERIKIAKLSEDPAAIEAAKNSLEMFVTNLKEQKISYTIDEAKGKISLKPKAKLKPEHDRIRQLVKNQIENAIKTIEKGMPKLSRHLRRSIIRRSEYTIYSPENPIEWFVKF